MPTSSRSSYDIKHGYRANELFPSQTTIRSRAHACMKLLMYNYSTFFCFGKWFLWLNHALAPQLGFQIFWYWYFVLSKCSYKACVQERRVPTVTTTICMFSEAAQNIFHNCEYILCCRTNIQSKHPLLDRQWGIKQMVWYRLVIHAPFLQFQWNSTNEKSFCGFSFVQILNWKKC